MEFIEWFSTYMVPIGLVLKMVIGSNRNFILEHKNDRLFKIKRTKIKKFILNEEQFSALKSFENLDDRFNVSVLEGTTGSGKTLVYFERIKNFKKNKQALVLLPEIFLTNEFKLRFEEFLDLNLQFGIQKSLKKKRIIWKGVINNKIKLVVGARSSLLLPLTNSD